MKRKISTRKVTLVKNVQKQDYHRFWDLDFLKIYVNTCLHIQSSKISNVWEGQTSVCQIFC